MILRLSLTALVLFLSACGTTASIKYVELPQSSESANLAALKNTTAQRLHSGEQIDTEIELTDPVIQLSESRGNYKLFSFIAPVDSLYTLKVMSLCSCFGFTKNLLYPVAYLMDMHGSVINDAPSSIELKEAAWGLPARIHGIWKGEAQAGEEYFFLVTADNRDPGRVVGSTTDDTYPVIGAHIEYKSYQTGKIRIQLILEEL